MHVIGIDFSLKNTGLALIDGQGKLCSFQTIELLSKKGKGTVGYDQIYEMVSGVLKVVQFWSDSYERTVFGIEDYYVGKGHWGGMNSVRAQGFLMAFLYQLHRPMFFVHPTRLRQYEKYPNDLYVPFEELNEHERDAYNMAILTLARISKKFRESFHVKVQQSISKLPLIFSNTHFTE